jgi:hypothetical protein
MKPIFFFLLISFATLGQNPKLAVKIDTIVTLNSQNYKTEYHINYHIENKTNTELSFFLMPNALIANTASSLSLYPVYKIYQNGIFEDMDGPFFEYETEAELEYAKIEDKKSPEALKLAKEFQDSQTTIAIEFYKKYKENGGESEDFQWVYYRQKLLNNIVTLKPKEIKNCTIKTLWNKNRYIKNGDLEYYLDEKNKIEIELILDLKTVLFKDQLSVEDLKKITDNPNFISGVFISNKAVVDFKE